MSQRDHAMPMSVDILSSAAQLYKKSDSKRLAIGE